MSPVCPGWEGCLQQREHRGWVSGLWQQGCGQLHAAVAGWHASCLLWLCQCWLAGRISSIKAGVLWKALQTSLHPWALCSDTQDCMLLPFPPFLPKLLCCWGFIHAQEGQLHWNVCVKWEMKCVEQMDGVGPRLGSKRRYLAALSNHLQDSEIKPSPGVTMPGGLMAVSDLSLPSQGNENPLAASLSLCYRRSMKRKGAGKRTTQSRAAKPNHCFRKEEKRQHFQSPKCNISMEIAGRGLLSVSDLVGLTRFCLFFPTSSIISGSSEDRLLCITNARFLVSDFWLSAKQSLEDWHLSFICSFLLAKVHFSHSMTLIDDALSFKCHFCDTLLLAVTFYEAMGCSVLWYIPVASEVTVGHCWTWMKLRLGPFTLALVFFSKEIQSVFNLQQGK